MIYQNHNTYTTTDTLKDDFVFRVNTEHLKPDEAELQSFIDPAIETYNNDVFGYKKVLVSSPTLALFAKTASDLSREGYSVFENERTFSSSIGRYAIKFIKPAEYQEEDRTWIKETIQKMYLAKVEDNFKAEKHRLIQEAVNEARRKDADEIAKKERTRLDKIEQAAIATLEKQLQEVN